MSFGAAQDYGGIGSIRTEAELQRFVEQSSPNWGPYIRQLQGALIDLIPYSAEPVTSNPTTTSDDDPMTAVIPEMEIIADFGTSPILVLFNMTHQANAAVTNQIELYDEGTAIATTRRAVKPGIDSDDDISLFHTYTPGEGERTLEIRWNNTGTGSDVSKAVAKQRSFIVIQFPAVG